jgi:hypothetical protein
MTDPSHSRAQHLVDQLARGDRSIAHAIHSVLSAADERGVAALDRIAVVYRDDYLTSLRVAGKDADQEAGRLSLDEVRYHLLKSVLPRLAGEGVVTVSGGGEGAETLVTFAPGVSPRHGPKWRRFSRNPRNM